MYFNMALIKKDGKFFKVGEEMRSDVHVINMSKKEKSESLTRIEPSTFRTPVGCSLTTELRRTRSAQGHTQGV